MDTDKKNARIIVVCGSPRKNGNSSLLAQRMGNGAASEGATVDYVFLHDMDISPCQSCYACQAKDSRGCAIDDDMQAIYKKLIESDVWVITSPVYWFNMSAQTKIFMDRCFALTAYVKDAFRGKKIAIVMAYGDKDPFASGCVNALRCFQDAFNYVGAKIVGMIYGSAMNAGEINSNEELMKEAEDLGKRLAKINR
ncbi:MAG: flavodoxin family protein [Desulfobacteraceae bacterium]|jgi:multimeric flavodoxin WrbA|nr:MAG: flavodoxin family protein [Desulfobacteraceae bacterium]